MIKLPALYFRWLQKDTPTGNVERFPELTDTLETSQKGIYCIGDLTGVPLMNIAAASGQKLISQFVVEEPFQRARARKPNDVLDVLIIGAGPAGVSAALAAREAGLSCHIAEASRPFATIHNFPKEKPIHIVDIPDIPGTSSNPPGNARGLTFNANVKETLLSELQAQLQAADLSITCNANVQSITRQGDVFNVQSATQSWRALRVVVAIGKSGNAKRLNVEGETLPKVYTRLIDANHHRDQDILVVGGGDSALEAAIALQKSGNRVTLSYRKDAFHRPKQENIQIVEQLISQKKLVVLFNSTVAHIDNATVTLQSQTGEQTLTNDAVYVLIGTQIPVAFFERANIRMGDTVTVYDRVVLILMILFSCVLYFGKSAPTTHVSSIGEFFLLPKVFVDFPIYRAVKAFVAYGSFIGLLLGAPVLLLMQIRQQRFRQSGWQWFKWMYFLFMLCLFGGLYIVNNLQGGNWLGLSMGSWYTAMYSLTIFVFGLRRMAVHPTPYIKKQTWTLIAVQCIPLFVLPLFVLPWLGEQGLLSDWVLTNVFPGQSYWRAFGFILGWPLFLYNLASGQPLLFWLIVSLVQTFVIIPFIVYRFGKGAYCGWICSCGALAETLGDEYRSKAPHGPLSKKLENAGQIVLWAAAIITIGTLLRTWGDTTLPGLTVAGRVYAIMVDIIFAGVLGVGVYFTLSGRVWCRFLCPLAALMHIFARFSLYRIFSNKSRCISCGICTRVCHMGIDVATYASRGVPMDDVECVRCSACVIHCPMDVLSFGAISKSNADTTSPPLPDTST